ncbi:MAG: carbon-nitrogen hydrolase family protein [Actinobacteria bacterium]|nr:carbon-nitrogen hydrolase family protein [Actinomycetota bacterium]
MRVAGVQMNTRGDVADNVRVATALVKEAAAVGARLVALPETWGYKGGRDGIRASAEAVDGPSNAALAQLAARLGIFVLAGSIYEPSPDPGRAYNTSALFGPDGRPRAVYRKIHLFDATAGATVYRESDDVTPGVELVTVTITPGEAVPGESAESAAPPAPVTLGLTICYDLRFPELYRSLALRGAQVLCVPSAFTVHTGAAHWEVLLRARAIENGCFVVAPGQVGEHLPGRECYGHSMIVDPWGTVLAEVQGGVGFCVADLDIERVAEVRAQIPSPQNRRPDAYDL